MATWRYSKSNSVKMSRDSPESTSGDSVTSSERSRGDSSSDDDDSLDLSYSELMEFPRSLLLSRPLQWHSLQLANNRLEVLPPELGLFTNLVTLDVSNNCLKSIVDDVCRLRHLRTLVARNNCLCVESIPKDFGMLASLAVLNLSGNELTQLPVQFTELPRVKCLYLGANRISVIPPQIQNMTK